MKFSRKTLLKTFLLLTCLIIGAFALARAAMPEWLQNIEVHSLVEAAIFRTVNLPGGPVIIKRPPAETVPALGDLLKQHPQQADLYSLKALEEEQKLDFPAAEADWKLYLQDSADKAAAEISLADFYHRRHRPADEVAALSAAARMPSPSSEKLTAASDQSSWQAFQRVFQVIDAQALGKSVAVEQYNAWIARYPQEPSLYVRYFEFLLNEKDFKAATELIAKYHAKFPGDEIFPIRARALLAYKQGSVEEGLAVYEKNFLPLWPPELIKNYFDLLRETRSLRKFLDQQHAALERNPDDLNAASRIFYYYQQQGNLQAAQQVITDYRLKKDARKAAWSSQELYTFARLLDAVHLYPEAARYYFALYNVPGAESQENALAGLANVLLAAPEQPVRFGAADLSMYKDIGTMDTGPGYLNGILSLLLNTTSPGPHYAEEEQRAVPYFHRSRAAELVAFFDQRFPSSSARPALHAQLIQAYADYGQDAAVIAAGNDFLKAFPSASDRNKVALLVADAYARTKNTAGEFAIYDNLLQELARKAEGVPLGGQSEQRQYRGQEQNIENNAASGNEGEEGEDTGSSTPSTIRGGAGTKQAFALQNANRTQQSVRSPEYQAVLDRYISRLVSLHRLPEALAVWRQELDRNPNDPGLYEKFAGFLDGNQLGTEEEAVYKRAIQQFPDKSWYHKLARWYLSKKRQQDLQALSEQVVRIFSGSELEAYLRDTYGAPQQLELRFNQLAHERFPHNLQFVDNLLSLYRSQRFSNPTEVERLLRNYWFTDPTMRSQFFEYLSRTGRLEAELEALNPAGGNPDWEAQAASNPAAARFFAEAELWRSHFEAAAPAIAVVAGQYLADAEVGERASSVYRSLAYFDPRNTRVAVQIETNLLAASPADRKRLARIGDIYSDREEFAKAAPYWNKMPDTEPGRAAAYEEAATVFWDYYFFDDALRLLNLGRSKLHDDALYAYQVGAIYENQGDYPRAVNEYVKGSLAEAASPEAHDRLLQLATRKSAREAVDAATGSAVVKTNYDLGAIQLRVQVLEAQQRREDLSQFLVAALDHTNSVETLEAIEGIAKDKSLESVRQHSLERQIATSSDPVRRLELRYALAGFYEQKKDVAGAQQQVEALYKENPRTMGVVRSTVDFYWRNKLQQRAVDVLMQAAKDSYPALKTQFSFEAARKMTEIGEYEQARKVLAGLLEASPYNAEYLAAVAETYARAGDNAGLRDFYQDKIKLFQKSGLAAEERKDRVAALRRGLVPALTALKDFAGAVDQYIEIINAYPEDADLVAEAANYAQHHQRKDQLLNFYTKTVAASPKDSRWAVVLARVQTNYEDFEGAIRTYAQAIKVRPDRTDLVTAKAAMEERLLRFDEAAADYATLYELAYHDARWMEKVAEIRARQSKPEQAVQALKTALIDGRPETPGKYFTMAERLEGWGMLSPAREYAEKGVALAGDDLLADSGNHSGAQIYTRILTTVRQQEAAYRKLETAIAAAQQPPSLAERVAKNGLEGITSSELRRTMLVARGNNARSGMAACMREMGTTAARYFTPEEKVTFGKFLESKNAAMARSDAYLYLLPAAEKAGLTPLQAKLMYEQLAAQPSAGISSRALEDLQTRRMKPLEAGQQLEQIALVRRSKYTESYLDRAQEMYKLAGSEADELRTLEELRQHNALQGEQQARYFELLLDRDPQRLVQLAARGQERDAAANFLIAHSNARLALSAIEARSGSEPAVWRSAYTALTGLYFKDQSAPVQNAFATVIADDTIGQRLAKTVNRKQALAGDIWFYYGSRYGEYLGITRKGDPEDFLPAEMEHAPLRDEGYFNTALYYEETGDLNRAIADYQHVADLNASRIDVHNRLAAIFWKQKHQEQALPEWKRALELLKVQTTTGRTPETFWGDFAATVDSLAGRKLFPQFQPDINEVLHNYVKRNGTYRITPLLLAVLPHTENPGAAGQLVLELSTDAPEKLAFLRLVLTDTKLKLDREPVYRRALELAQDSVRTAEGAARQYAEQEFEGLQIEWLQYLLQQKEYDRLRSELAALPKPVWERRTELAGIQLKLAAQAGDLDAVLSGYRADAEHAPAAGVLRKAATEIQKAGDVQSARKILEFVFSREIENHNLTAPNMLGLAEIRIEQGDLDAAVALLRRMTLVVGNPFENHDAAAALLVRTGHPAQAADFLAELVKAVPWNAQYRGRLAQAQIAANQDVEAAQKDLIQIVSNQYIAYADRITFADGLHGAVPQNLGSAELNYLAGAGAQGNINPDQPFFFAARIKAAAAKNTPATEQVRLLRAALEDTPYGDTARVPLLKAASEAGDFYLALTAMQPYISGNSYRGGMGLADEAEDADSTAPELQPEDDNNPRPTLPKLLAKDRAEINREIGMALVKTKAPDQGLPYLQQAYWLETDPTLKAQLNREVQRIRFTQRRQAANQKRQPEVHSELEQPRTVRPKLPEQVASAQKGAAQ